MCIVSEEFNFLLFLNRGTAWENWLKHCGTSWKAAGAISDCVFGLFIDIILPAALWSWV